MTTECLCDRDLYRLSLVSRYLSIVTFPLYLRRRQLVLSGLPYSVDLHGEGFAVVDIWRQSSYFPPLKLLRCSFNTDVALAAMEMRCIFNFFHSLRTMEHVHLENMKSVDLDNILILLGSVSGTRCHTLTLTMLAFEGSRSGLMRRGMGGEITLWQLQNLILTHCQLSPSQWLNFLFKLTIPSLRTLHVVGLVSLRAAHAFLLAHSGICALIFEKCLWTDRPTSLHRLNLPQLSILRGSSSQILLILGCFRSTRSLRELSIEANSPPQANFFDDVIQCLALCKGPLILELNLPQVTGSLPQAITGVRAMSL